MQIPCNIPGLTADLSYFDGKLRLMMRYIQGEYLVVNRIPYKVLTLGVEWRRLPDNGPDHTAGPNHGNWGWRQEWDSYTIWRGDGTDGPTDSAITKIKIMALAMAETVTDKQRFGAMIEAATTAREYLVVEVAEATEKLEKLQLQSVELDNRDPSGILADQLTKYLRTHRHEAWAYGRSDEDVSVAA